MNHAAGHRVRDVLSVSNDPAVIERAEERVLSSLSQFHYPKASLFAVRLCLHEALSNSFRHGHRGLPENTPVRLSFDATAGQVEIHVEDQGPGFDPAEVPDPTLEENLERGSGRGLLLIRAYMAEAEYNAKGNSLRMVYKRPAGA
ncbi:serine/threonine-protein kinase RsbW [Phycisphaerales bacterium]|nr:serine/threonine-protein kinase RsbW [Phycisphaerales bacterium]